MENKDYYNILGVDKNAPKEDIKKAYRKLAHKHHPDKTGGDDKKFKEINEAYYILGDEKRRAEFDRYGRVFSGSGGGQGHGFEGFNGFDFSNFSSGGFEDISDIFGDFFGFKDFRGRTQKRRGRDISMDIELSFEEAVFGTTRKVLITKPVICKTCDGKGGAVGSEQKTCPKCGGAGKIHETKNSFFGTFTTLKECGECRGVGKIFTQKCKECKGNGILRKSEEIVIEVPAGIEKGEMIKLHGKGEAMSHGISGDLYVKVHIKPHSALKREGNNLIMDLNIPLSEALLGGERKINTLEGEIKIKIPAGINYGEILRVREKGVPAPNQGRGDLLIRVIIKLPKNLSRKAKKLIEELKEEGI